MKMPAAEAKTKRCPFVDARVLKLNADYGPAHVERLKSAFNCIAGECIAWSWHGPAQQTLFTSGRTPALITVPSGDGWVMDGVPHRDSDEDEEGPHAYVATWRRDYGEERPGFCRLMVRS